MHRIISRNAFTLIESLVVCAIMSLLLAMMVPAIQRVRAASQLLSCKNNMRNIGLALQNYHQQQGRLPTLDFSKLGSNTPEGQLGWMALLLPYIEQDSLYAKAISACSQTTNSLNPAHSEAMSSVVTVYYCPVDNRLSTALEDETGRLASFTSYLGIAGVVIDQKTGKSKLGYFGCRNLKDMSDGLSNTLAFGERPPPGNLRAGWWYPHYICSPILNSGPNNAMTIGAGASFQFGSNDCGPPGKALGYGNISNPCDRFHFWSLHGNGANFALADNSVRFLPYSANEMVYKLASCNGGEIVEID